METNKTIPAGLSSLNDSQREIAEDILAKVAKSLKSNGEVEMEDRIFSIKGAAGTGKSFLTTVLVAELKKITSKMMLTTPTHRSLAILTKMGEANKVEAKTIHSYLKCKVVENYNTGTLELKQNLDKPIESVDVLFCDEASMVNSSLFEMIQTQLFNGTIKTLIFVGDPNQLLPVEEGDNNPIYCDLLFNLTLA